MTILEDGHPRWPAAKKVSYLRFTVGHKISGHSNHVIVEAEDALAAALKVKADQPDAIIMYVRPQNRRGDARHPVHQLPD